MTSIIILDTGLFRACRKIGKYAAKQIVLEGESYEIEGGDDRVRLYYRIQACT